MDEKPAIDELFSARETLIDKFDDAIESRFDPDQYNTSRIRSSFFVGPV